MSYLKLFQSKTKFIEEVLYIVVKDNETVMALKQWLIMLFGVGFFFLLLNVLFKRFSNYTIRNI